MGNNRHRRYNPNTAHHEPGQSGPTALCISILAVVAFAPTVAAEVRPGPNVVFSCNFGPEWDKNFDQWPDGWTRRRGPGYPHYVKIQLADAADEASGRSLQVNLNGGAAAAFSPPIPLSAAYDYVLEGRIRTEGLRQNRAFLSLAFLDEKQQTRKLVRSAPAASADQWQTLRLGPVEPPCAEVCNAVIGLHVEPPDELHADLQGIVRLGVVRLIRVPRIRVTLSRPSCLFVVGEPIAASCSVSGLKCEELRVHFILQDVDGRQIGSSLVPAVLDPPAAPPKATGPDVAPDPAGQGRRFSATWELPELQPGYYYLQTVIGEQYEEDSPHTVGFAVLGAAAVNPDVQFGWTISRSELPLAVDQMVWIFTHSAVGRLRCSVRALVDSAGKNSLQRLLADPRFHRGNRELVGVLDALPADFQKRFPGIGSPLEVLVFPQDQWSDELEAYASAAGSQLAWWQIGGDTHTQLAGYPQVSETVAAVQRTLQRVNPSVRIGLVWDAEHPIPGTLGPPSCSFLVLRVPYQTTQAEMVAKLARLREQQSLVPLWMVLEPEPKQAGTPVTRAKTLLEKFVAARASGTAAIFVPNVFDRQFGLIEPNGQVTPLFVVWHNAAKLLAGRYLGSISLPNGSENAVFSRRDEAVMVVWNDSPSGPVEETLVLGADVSQVDPWGRRLPVESGDGGQTIAAGPLPTMITGLDPNLVGWRQQCRLAPSTLPSIPGQPHVTTLSITNVFAGEVSGRATIIAPDGWIVEPSEVQFHLLPGESAEQQLRIALPFDTPCGLHPMRIDFELSGADIGHFRVFRRVDVQPEGLHVRITTRLGAQDELEVTAEIANLVDRTINLRCHLFAPGRRRSSQLVPNLGRGSTTISYRLANGKDLLDKTLWLRAEQIGGPQVLNYRFVASP